jgi:peptide/nickel transport system substrate-binding protein
MTWRVHLVLAAVLTGASASRPAPLAAQRGPSGIVIVTGQQATVPIPTLMENGQDLVANFEIADQLFLRLANVGPGLVTAGDHGFVPQLARRWTRRDSITLAFQLDPRARWHDGEPVTAKDVVFTFGRAGNPAIAPRLADAIRRIASVEAEGERDIVVRFKESYSEQLYDATFHVAILPSHLLEKLPATGKAWGPFIANPVGSGPYRWVRREEQFIELAANRDFFLGRPGIERVIVQVAVNPDARLNLLLSGDADAMDNIPAPISNYDRVKDTPHLRTIEVPSPNLGYLLFNQRDPKARDKPHPILADRDVRRALVLALDRATLVRAVLGPYGKVPFGPVSAQFWIRHGAPPPARQDQSLARRLLSGRGWVDRDGDGIRENKDGAPLTLRLQVTSSSPTRLQMAEMVQQQLRQVGVNLELARMEPKIWSARRRSGDFDIDFSAATMDPTPSGMVFSWTCDGALNVAKYCDRGADSLLSLAIANPSVDPKPWHAFLQRVEADAPAAFIYSQTYVYGVNRRFSDVVIRPESSWIGLWRWIPPRS